ncbi:SLAC1 family transporter [Cellulomonas soli]
MRSLQRVPVGFFGMVLGVFGLGSAWRYAGTIGLAPHWVGEVGVLAGCAVWLVLALIYAYRFVAARERVLAEWSDPGQFAFISLLPAGAVLVSAGVRPYVPVVSGVLLAAGVVGQLTFSAVRCAPCGAVRSRSTRRPPASTCRRWRRTSSARSPSARRGTPSSGTCSWVRG